MSFGYAVTDFIQLGNYAFKLFQACDVAAETFQELAQQCLSIYIAVGQTLRSLPDPKLSDQNYEDHVKLSAITTGCRTTLCRLERMMARYPSLASPSPTAWDTLTFALRLLVKNDLSDMRSKLTFHLVALSVFMAGMHGNKLDTVATRLDHIPGSHTLLRPLSQEPTSQDLGWAHEVPRSCHSQNAPSTVLNESTNQTSTADYTTKALQEAMATKREVLQMALDDSVDVQPWFSLLTANQQGTLSLPLPTFRYSKRDERLSRLPEGWRRVMTSETSYKYQYLLGPKFISSRLYSMENPFPTTLNVELSSLPPGWVESSSRSRGPYYIQPGSGNIQFTRPSTRIQAISSDHSVGWISKDGLPLDLTDTCSKELARATYLDNSLPWEDIKRAISKIKGLRKWKCASDGDGNPIYTNSDPAVSDGYHHIRTVHPIYFIGDKDSANLPPGWDYRLDTWGGLFYVDHNTCTARRQHPKYDATIDLSTGLPRGWERSTDHIGVEYFFESATLLATYQGGSMKVDNPKMKFALERRPTPGAIPPFKELEVWDHTVAGALNEESSLELMVETVASYPSGEVVDPSLLVLDKSPMTKVVIKRRSSV